MHRLTSQFLPASQLTPGGLKGRGALGEPGRSRRYAPRARERDALPVTQAEREPQAPAGSRRRAPTTARDRRSLGPLARQRRARTPQGATRPRRVVRKMRCVFRQCGKSEIFPLAVRTRCVLTTLPDDVGHAARIRRILATSRESVALSNDSESRAARRLRRLGPCERAGGPRAAVERAEGLLGSSIRI